MRRVILILIFSERAAWERGGGGGVGRCQPFFFFFFPCSADHERDWPPCKVVFFGLATNTLDDFSLNNNSSEGLGAFRFFFKQQQQQGDWVNSKMSGSNPPLYWERLFAVHGLSERTTVQTSYLLLGLFFFYLLANPTQPDPYR